MSDPEPNIPDTDNIGVDIEEGLRSERVTVFQNETLLHPTKIVDEDRIYGRNRQLNDVIQLLKRALDDVPPKDMLLHGTSGTGKSLIIGTVAKKLVRIARQQGQNMTFVEINCGNLKTEDKAVYRLIDKLATDVGVEPAIKKNGTSTSDKYDRLFDIIREHLDLAIIILDEADLLIGNRINTEAYAYSDLLYNLTRSNEIGDLDNQVAVAALTNDADSLMNNLDSRTKSSFSPRPILFDDYDADELREILIRRRDAFKEDALSDDVIPLVAAFAAQEEGDARQAIDLIRLAGERADKMGDSLVTADHVREARTEVDKEFALNILEGASVQKQAIVLAAVLCDIHNPTDLDGVPGKIAYEVYKNITNSMDLDTLTLDSTRNWLDEYETSSLFSTKTKGYGQGKGRHKIYHFQKDPDAVLEALARSGARLDDALEHRDQHEHLVVRKYRELES